MEIIAKYIHGSHDSIDTDVYYVVDTLPSDDECAKLHFADLSKDRNFITIKDGIVDKCWEGTPDEVNNSILDTYNLHPQTCPLLITRRVERNVPLKCMRAVRGILSILSRTQYRKEIKSALKGSWNQRIYTLRSINLAEIDWDNLQKRMNGIEAKKFVAFQIGQALGLLYGKELYTKGDISDAFPLLKKFLYRDPDAVIGPLEDMKNVFASQLHHMDVIDHGSCVAQFVDYCVTYDLRHERLVKSKKDD